MLDQTDGTMEQVNKAFGLAQLCWNLAILPEDGLEKALGEMQVSGNRTQRVVPLWQRKKVQAVLRGMNLDVGSRTSRSIGPQA